MTDDDFQRRFGGVSRLYGAKALERLRAAHAAVVGIGGVGSWAVEALARSGVGRITLIDFDDICLTNINRQIHALDEHVGRMKVTAMEGRIARINPNCEVIRLPHYIRVSNVNQMLARGFDVVLDAIDSVEQKAAMIAETKRLGVPIVVSGGAGGKRDPLMIRVADLSEATHDPLLKKTRRLLRDTHGLSGPLGVPSVFSIERSVFGWSDGCVRSRAEPGASLRLDCSSGFGTACHVTGSFGFAVAARAIEILVSQKSGRSSRPTDPPTSPDTSP